MVEQLTFKLPLAFPKHLLFYMFSLLVMTPRESQMLWFLSGQVSRVSFGHFLTGRTFLTSAREISLLREFPGCCFL
jgi:hypothetical protein